MSDARERFEGGAANYASARPDYPETILAPLVAAIEAGPAGLSDVLDVGSGTGIFARQLRVRLDARFSVTGIEPSADMRGQAEAVALPGLRFVEGRAEELAFAAASVRAVLAATAAHWFDRPLFYAEAARVLRPGGLLAIVEYERDPASPAARAVLDFLDRHGEPRSQARPDYRTEIGAEAGFGDVRVVEETVTLALTPPRFAALALSSSHARRAIETLGRARAGEILEAIAHELAGPGGAVPFGYVFRCFTARRR